MITPKELKAMSDKDRAAYLNNYADRIVTDVYTKPLSEEEIEAERASISDAALEITNIDEERKKKVAEFKQLKKPHQEALKEAVKNVNRGQKRIEAELYMIADHEEGMMYIFDEEGDQINKRKLQPNERQKTIHSINK